MPQVMQADLLKAGCSAHSKPNLIDASERTPRSLANKHMGIGRRARQAREKF
jgi:hypothetical protein